jgi:hypothetical protein
MPLTPVDRLRRMVGDRLPIGGNEADCFFANEEIQDLIDEAGSDMNLAALNGWLAKMAEFAKLVDRDTSGANIKLSQMYKNAESMARFYGTRIANMDASFVGHVIGRVVSLREAPCVPRVMTGSSGFRLEAHNTEARALMQRDKPETLEDPTYPEPGPVAT